MQTLSERIKFIRSSAKLTQNQFGKKLSVSGSYISRLESGKEQPTEMLLKLIALTFDVSTQWLETGKGTIKINKDSMDYFDRGFSKEHFDSLNDTLEEIKNFANNNSQFPVALNLSAMFSALNDMLKKLSINPSVGTLIFQSISDINLELCYQIGYLLEENNNAANFDAIMYKQLIIMTQVINEQLKEIIKIFSDYGNSLNIE